MSLNTNLTNVVSLDQLAKLVGAKTLEYYDEALLDNDGCSCSEELQSQGKCECGFEDRREHLANVYIGALELIANRLLNEHGLRLADTKNSWDKKIVPMESWKDAADRIRHTINGYGMFEFGTLKEFLDSGPYTDRGAVLNHLHWIKTWYQVYGSPNAQGQLDRALR